MSKTLNELKQERKTILDSLLKMTNTAIDEKRSFNTNELSIERSLNSTVANLEGQIYDLEMKDEEAKRTGKPVDVGGNNVPAFRQWLNQSITGESKEPFKVDYRADPILSTTDLNIKLKTVASMDVLTSPSQQLLQDLGVKFMTGLKGTVTLPYMAEDVAGFVNEASTGASANMASLSNSIAPRRITHTQTITKEAIANTTDDFLNSIMNNLITGCWNAVANDYFDSLDADCPNQVKTIKGSTLSFDDIVSMEASIGSYTLTSPRYVMNNVTKAFLKKTSALTNNSGAIWSNNIVNDYPSYGTTSVNGNRVTFGDFSKSVVGIWQGVNIIVDPFTMAADGKIKFTADMLVDTGVYNPSAFCIISNASTN